MGKPWSKTLDHTNPQFYLIIYVAVKTLLTHPVLHVLQSTASVG